MPEKLHLIIPGAVLPADDDAAVRKLPPMMPRLRALLASMAPTSRIECADDSPASPFEIALAAANGLPVEPGHIPWAAFETATVGVPCGFIKLCHLQVGADHVVLMPPEEMFIDAETSGVLLAAMAPYLLEDGITLHPYGAVPGTWLATGEPFRKLRTVSPDQLRGRRLTKSMLESPDSASALFPRLQNEMQMLLYTHPVNEVRQRNRLLTINSFWVTGAGVLDKAVPVAPDVRVEARLFAAAQHRDAAAHAAAWQQVDADSCADLLARLRSGSEVRLTLCGDRAAQTLEPAKTGFWRQFVKVLSFQPIFDVREQL